MICECVFSLLVASKHFNATRELNEFNPGIIAERSDGGTVSIYYNSYKKVSFGVGHTVSLGSVLGIGFSGNVSMVTGYRYPIQASFKAGYAGHNIHFIPPIPTFNSEGIRFKRQWLLAYSKTL